MQKLQEQGAYLVPKKDYKKIADFVFKPNTEGYGVAGPVAGMSRSLGLLNKLVLRFLKVRIFLLFELDKKNIGEALSSEKLITNAFSL